MPAPKRVPSPGPPARGPGGQRPGVRQPPPWRAPRRALSNQLDAQALTEACPAEGGTLLLRGQQHPRRVTHAHFLADCKFRNKDLLSVTQSTCLGLGYLLELPPLCSLMHRSGMGLGARRPLEVPNWSSGGLGHTLHVHLWGGPCSPRHWACCISSARTPGRKRAQVVETSCWYSHPLT